MPQTIDYAAELSVALAAARRAGEIICEGFGADHSLSFKKSHSDLVTEFDKRAEQEIVRIITAAFPSHQIVAEEGSTGGAHPEYCWYIDPIDGTTNFAHAYPLVCTSIGLAHDGELVLGVVYSPLLNELFIGVKGQGATLEREAHSRIADRHTAARPVGDGLPI